MPLAHTAMGRGIPIRVFRSHWGRVPKGSQLQRRELIPIVLAILGHSWQGPLRQQGGGGRPAVPHQQGKGFHAPAPVAGLREGTAPIPHSANLH